MAIPDKRVLFAGALNAIPSPNDLYQWVKNSAPYNANFSQDYLKKERSPARGIPCLLQPLGDDSHFTGENFPQYNLYPTRVGDVWQLTFYACANKNTAGGLSGPFPTVQAWIFGADINGKIYNPYPTFYQTVWDFFTVTTEWTKFTLNLAITHPDVKFIQSRFDGPDEYNPLLDTTPAAVGDPADKLLLWFDDFRLVRLSATASMNTSPYTLDNFVADYKGSHLADTFRIKAQSLLPYWMTNDTYVCNLGVRYGLFKKPSAASLSAVTDYAITNSMSYNDYGLNSVFFNALTGDNLTRSQTNVKTFDSGPYSGTFYDKADIPLGVFVNPAESPTVVSIYKTIQDNIDGDSPLRNPWAYIDSIYFDTRFNYLNIPKGLSGNITLNFPYVANRTQRKRKKKKKKTIDIPYQERRKTVIYQHNFGKIPLAVCYEVRGDGQAGYFFGGTTIIQQNGRGSYRLAWIEADATYLYLVEWSHTIELPLTALTMNIRAYIFDKISNAFPTGSVTLPSSPSALMVVGGEKGKVWQLREQTSSPKYYLVQVITMPSDPEPGTPPNQVPPFKPTWTSIDYTEQQLYITSNYWDFDAYSSEWFVGTSRENRGILWDQIEYPGDGEYSPLVGLTRTCIIPDGSRTYLGLSYTQAYPVVYNSIVIPTNPTKYSIYKSNANAVWTKVLDLADFTQHKFCSGGGGITCSATGNAVVVATMFGGQEVYGVKFDDAWLRYDLENFSPQTTTITFSAPELSGGVTATGTPVVDIGSRLVGVKITNPGSGYLKPPTLTIGDSDTTPVVGTVTVTMYNSRTVPAVYGNTGPPSYTTYLITPEEKYWKVQSASASGTSWLHKKTSKITFSGSSAKGTLTIANGICTGITITDEGNEIGPSASAPTSVTAVISDTDNGTEGVGTYKVQLSQRKHRKTLLMHSSNYGVSWSSITPPTNTENSGLRDVICNSNGIFVAVGYDNVILRSTNGSSWSIVSFVPSGYTYDPLINWKRVIVAQGYFWAVGHNNALSYIIKSADGTTWTQVSDNTVFQNVILEDMAYVLAKGILVVVGRRAQSHLQFNPVITGPDWVYENEPANIVVSNLKPGATFTWAGVTWNGFNPGSGSTTVPDDGILYFSGGSGTALAANIISTDPPWDEAGGALKVTYNYSCDGKTFQYHYWILKKTTEDPATSETDKNKASVNPFNPPKLEVADLAQYTTLYVGATYIPSEDQVITTSAADYEGAFYFSEDTGATWVAGTNGITDRLYSVAPMLDYNPGAAAPPAPGFTIGDPALPSSPIIEGGKDFLEDGIEHYYVEVNATCTIIRVEIVQASSWTSGDATGWGILIYEDAPPFNDQFGLVTTKLRLKLDPQVAAFESNYVPGTAFTLKIWAYVGTSMFTATEGFTGGTQGGSTSGL